MNTFDKKLVAVINEKIATGKLMNALAHMALGLGAHTNKEELRFTNYKDKDGNDHDKISEIPFIILKAKNSNKIMETKNLAKEKHVTCIDFTDTMTIGTYEEQIKKTSETKEEQLDYYGVVLFGDWQIVSELTKKFSLWKEST